jgi:hypothetical protein
MVCGCATVGAGPSAVVSAVESSGDGLSLEWVVELFSTAFEQVCALRVGDGFGVA